MTQDGIAPEGSPVIQYWHSEEIPADVAEMMATFRDHNPDRRHLVFCEETAERLIEEHFTDREVAAFRSCAVPAMQADYLRYCAVYVFGGFFSDVDFRCLRPLRTLIDNSDNGLLFWREPPGNVTNGIFLFRPCGHPLLRLALDVATANIERRAAEMVNYVTGPWIFTGLAALNRLGSFDAARQHVASGGLEPFAALMLDAVGNFARVEEAFEDVSIASFDTATKWVSADGGHLQYKQGDMHWINWQRRGASIYR